LISAASPNDHLVSAAAPFGGGYLVHGEGNGAFSIALMLQFHYEVHLIPFATTTTSHTPTGPMTWPATTSDEFTPCPAKRIMRLWLCLFFASHTDAA
jgi:hypothetical protein